VLSTDVPVEMLNLLFSPEPFTRWFDDNLVASVRAHGVLYPLLVALKRLRFDLACTVKRFDESDFRWWRRRKGAEAGLPQDGDHWLPR
jgi:hypothetical protein